MIGVSPGMGEVDMEGLLRRCLQACESFHPVIELQKVVVEGKKELELHRQD